MESRFVRLTLILLLLLLFSVGHAQAKGIIIKATITGPGLSNGIEITDEERLNIFRDFEFAGQIAKPQTVENQPHFDIRTSIGYDTEIFMTEVYHYYPASAEHPSYIYRTVVNNGIPQDVQYFLPSQKTDLALRNLLADLDASLPNGRNISRTTILVWFIACCCFFIITGKIARLIHPATNRVIRLPN